jgi:hypothetical protein
MRAPNARTVEEIAADAAVKVSLAKLIHHACNLLGVVGAKAIQLDERRIPGFNLFSDDLNWVLAGFHGAHGKRML